MVMQVREPRRCRSALMARSSRPAQSASRYQSCPSDRGQAPGCALSGSKPLDDAALTSLERDFTQLALPAYPLWTGPPVIRGSPVRTSSCVPAGRLGMGPGTHGRRPGPGAARHARRLATGVRTSPPLSCAGMPAPRLCQRSGTQRLQPENVTECHQQFRGLNDPIDAPMSVNGSDDVLIL
jgi:hypothetical protein